MKKVAVISNFLCICHLSRTKFHFRSAFSSKKDSTWIHADSAMPWTIVFPIGWFFPSNQRSPWQIPILQLGVSVREQKKNAGYSQLKVKLHSPLIMDLEKPQRRKRAKKLGKILYCICRGRRKNRKGEEWKGQWEKGLKIEEREGGRKMD